MDKEAAETGWVSPFWGVTTVTAVVAAGGADTVSFEVMRSLL